MERLGLMADLARVPIDSTYAAAFEGMRHDLLPLHARLGQDDRTCLRPLLDLLTSIHCSSAEPLASGVLSFCDAQQTAVRRIMYGSLMLRMLVEPRVHAVRPCNSWQASPRSWVRTSAAQG